MDCKHIQGPTSKCNRFFVNLLHKVNLHIQFQKELLLHIVAINSFHSSVNISHCKSIKNLKHFLSHLQTFQSCFYCHCPTNLSLVPLQSCNFPRLKQTLKTYSIQIKCFLILDNGSFIHSNLGVREHVSKSVCRGMVKFYLKCKLKYENLRMFPKQNNSWYMVYHIHLFALLTKIAILLMNDILFYLNNNCREIVK